MGTEIAPLGAPNYQQPNSTPRGAVLPHVFLSVVLISMDNFHDVCTYPSIVYVPFPSTIIKDSKISVSQVYCFPSKPNLLKEVSSEVSQRQL